MLNKKDGISTYATILITMVVTMLLCYVVTNIWYYIQIFQGEEKIEYENSFMKLEKVKSIIDSSYLREYDEEELENETISGMLKGLNDPYAAYYNEEAFEAFYTQTEGEYEGVGIYVAYDSNRKMPIVISPIIGSPAADAGILPGDYIEYVDELQAASATYDELVDAIKGKVGTKVKIGLLRLNEDDSYEEIEMEIERKKIDINPVAEEVYENNIGYIKLTSFDEASYDNFKTKYLDLIDNKNVKGLIIDLRNNPGGILQVCAQITDLIVPEGKIVYTIDKAGKEETLYSDKNQIEIPLVILVNEGSASASEVFTAAVKDYGVGKIVGTKTYGKGVVQTLKSLGDGSYIKLTTSEYFSPNGNKIDGLGVEPDVVVEISGDQESYYELSFEEDTQLQVAIEELKKMMWTKKIKQ